MENLTTTTVSKIVAKNFKTAKVFTEYGIDFCCKGGISLAQACEQYHVDLAVITEKIKNVLVVPETNGFAAMSMGNLAEYIEKTHHAYVKETIPVLRTYLEKIAQVHGQNHPELLEVRDLFQESSVEFTQHMAKEEQLLFPYIKAMEASLKNGETLATSHFGHVKNPIAMMEMEHEQEGDRFRTIATLTNNYTPPRDACQTYKVAFSVLQEFEEDLHKHIHLENNILFPNAIAAYNQNLA